MIFLQIIFQDFNNLTFKRSYSQKKLKIHFLEKFTNQMNNST